MVTVADCKELTDPTRSFIGKEQEQWLYGNMSKAKAKWNAITQSQLFSQLREKTADGQDARWTEDWNGYPNARDRIIQKIVQTKLSNPVILGGDIHSFWVNDLQAIDNLRMTGGVVPPFHKHFDPVLSPEAFALKVGEVSKLIEMSDGSRVMMKCDKHIPADATKTYADVRLFLEDELKAQKLAAMIPEKFSDMRKAANAKVYLKKETLAIAPPPPLPPKTATIGAPTPLPAP